MSTMKNGTRRCDGCGRFSRHSLGEYRKTDGSAGYINSHGRDDEYDYCEECEGDKLAAARNVARCLLQYTGIVRHANGRGRRPTYAADATAIRDAGRQLAELVLAILGDE